MHFDCNNYFVKKCKEKFENNLIKQHAQGEQI